MGGGSSKYGPNEFHCLLSIPGIWHTYVFGDEGGEVEASANQSTDHSIGSTLNRDMRSSSRRG